jgi:hypothetical protein
VGLNGPWGIPIFKSQTKTRMTAWGGYPAAPWEYMRKNNALPPDLILIDGRFRVACALTCLQHLKGNRETTILVDDYLNRPHFQIIEEFANLEGYAGQMAIFRAKPCDKSSLAKQIQVYQADWR